MEKKLGCKMENVSSLFKYCYIIHILLAFNTLLLDNLILKITSAIVLFLGAIVILYRFIHLKSFIKYPFLILYMFFVISYIFSSLLNFKYGWTGNAKIIIWMILQFGALYLLDVKREYTKSVKEFKICLFLMIGITSLMNLISIIMLFSGYCGYYETSDGKSFLIGVAYWGRLYGIHTDPNYGSVLSVVALLAAVYIFIQSKKKWLRRLMGVSVVLQAMFIAFSASRTGIVTMCVCVIVFAFICALRKYHKFFRALLISVIAVAIVLGVNKGLIVGYNAYATVVSEISVKSHENREEADKKIEIGRKGELEGDVSNRRFDLWENAIQITRTSPLLGVSYGNIVQYAEDNVPDSYLLTNGFTVFNAFHNMFMDLLASQGIVGFVIFLCIIFTSLRYVFKNYKKIYDEEQLACTFLFSACIGMMVSSLFVSEILYVNNQITVLFWTLWGFMIYFCYKGKQKETEREHEC